MFSGATDTNQHPIASGLSQDSADSEDLEDGHIEEDQGELVMVGAVVVVLGVL